MSQLVNMFNRKNFWVIAVAIVYDIFLLLGQGKVSVWLFVSSLMFLGFLMLRYYPNLYEFVEENRVWEKFKWIGGGVFFSAGYCYSVHFFNEFYGIEIVNLHYSVAVYAIASTLAFILILSGLIAFLWTATQRVYTLSQVVFLVILCAFLTYLEVSSTIFNIVLFLVMGGCLIVNRRNGIGIDKSKESLGNLVIFPSAAVACACVGFFS